MPAAAARAAGQQAAKRAAELREHQLRLRARLGRDIDDAVRSLAAAVAALTIAEVRRVAARERSAVAHDRAAAMHDRLAMIPGPRSGGHEAEAIRHRAAAEADRGP